MYGRGIISESKDWGICASVTDILRKGTLLLRNCRGIYSENNVVLRGSKMKLRKLALASIAAAVMAVGMPAQADYSTTILDQGVQFTITQVGAAGSFNFILGVDTTGYTGGAGVFLTDVDVKVSSSGGTLNSYTGPGEWADVTGSGPINASSDGCGTGNGGFLCVSDTLTNNAPAGSGGVYSFSFTATGNLSDPSKWHVGARFADANNVRVGSFVSATAPIPEPEIYAMMAVGLGFVGWAARRRKLKETVAA